MDFDHPSALCNKLAAANLDVALVSSFEFLRNPIYRIVDDVSISSEGPVYSVVVAHRGEVADIEEIELDPASETSANLLRCLIAERELNPRVKASTLLPAGVEKLHERLHVSFRHGPPIGQPGHPRYYLRGASSLFRSKLGPADENRAAARGILGCSGRRVRASDLDRANVGVIHIHLVIRNDSAPL